MTFEQMNLDKNIIQALHTLGSVSYTHLDVYKRQYVWRRNFLH